jgi:biopolymer transport protein ExbD
VERHTWRLDGVALAKPQLSAALQQIAHSNGAVRVRTLPEVHYERWLQTLSIAQAAGVQKLSFDELSAREAPLATP